MISSNIWVNIPKEKLKKLKEKDNIIEYCINQENFNKEQDKL